MERVLEYVEQHAPEIHERMLALWRGGAVEIDRGAQAVRLRAEASPSADVREQFAELAAALATIRAFPEPSLAVGERGPVSVIVTHATWSNSPNSIPRNLLPPPVVESMM